MSVFLGSNQIKQIYLGSNRVSKMYLGSNVIYEGVVLHYHFMPKTGEVDKEVYFSGGKSGGKEIISIPEKVLMTTSGGIPVECSVVATYPFSFSPLGLYGPKQIKLPETLKYIDNNSFSNNNKLEKINIPTSVKIIGGNKSDPDGTSFGYSFYNCKSLTSVTFDDTSGWEITGASITSKQLENDLKDPVTAAAYLRQVYVNKVWTKTS